MKFEIKHKDITKEINIHNEIDLDQLFKYKGLNVYYIPFGTKTLGNQERNSVVITNNTIEILGPNETKYEKSGIDSVKITLFSNYKISSETEYEDRKQTIRTQYNHEGDVDCIVYFSNEKRFKKEIYDYTKRVISVEYFDSFEMLFLTRYKDEIKFHSRRKNLKYFIENTTDKAIKMTKITPFIILGIKYYEKIMEDIKQNKYIFV